MLFQNTETKDSVENVGLYLEGLLICIASYQINPVDLQGRPTRQLEGLLRTAKMLASQLRCQRGAYKIDQCVALGDPFVETLMNDPKVTDIEVGESAVVSCIISNRIVKLLYVGSDKVEAQISKARVLVSVEGGILLPLQGDVEPDLMEIGQ